MGKEWGSGGEEEMQPEADPGLRGYTQSHSKKQSADLSTRQSDSFQDDLFNQLACIVFALSVGNISPCYIASSEFLSLLSVTPDLRCK